MPSIIACPACTGQLRLPDEVLGQQVCCPKCSHVFTAAPPVSVVTPPSAPPSPVPSVDAATGHEFEPAAKPRGLVGAVELKPALDEPEPPRRAPEPSPSPPPFDRGRHDEGDEVLWPCPECGKRNHSDATRCYSCDARLDSRGYDHNESRFHKGEPERRDRQPNRGVMILLLGIFSLLCVTLPLSPLGVILGLVAWLMGHGDLNRMKAQEMDPDGGLTKGGWICGIIGTVVNTLLTLSCLGFFSYIMVEENSRPPATYNQPVRYRSTPPNNGGMKQNNPPNIFPPPPPRPNPMKGVPRRNNPRAGPPG